MMQVVGMTKNSYHIIIVLILTLVTLLSGCTEKVTINDTFDANGVANVTINDRFDADEVAGKISGVTLDIINSLSGADFDNKVIYGSSGKATVNGKKTHKESSSTNSVSSTNTADITIVFDNYKSPKDNNGVTLHGTIRYNYDYRSRQLGLTWSSDESISMSGSSIKVSKPSYPGGRTISDTVTFAFNKENNRRYGWIEGKNGVRYDISVYLS